MKHPDCLDNRTAEEIESGVPQVRVRLVNISETALQLRAGAWAKDPATGFAMKCDLLRSIKLRFDEAGLSLARPQQTVYLKHQQTPDA